MDLNFCLGNLLRRRRANSVKRDSFPLSGMHVYLIMSYIYKINSDEIIPDDGGEM